MIHTAELAKAVARTEQARQKKAEVLAMIRSHGARHAVTQLKQREKQYEYYRNKLLTFE